MNQETCTDSKMEEMILIMMLIMLVMFTFYMCLNAIDEQYELLYARIKHLETELEALQIRRSDSIDEFVEEFADKKND